MRAAHIDHAHIALHNDDKSDYIYTIERRTFEADLASRCREIPMKQPTR